MTVKDKVQISELIKKPLPSHGIFLGLWGLLLILGGLLHGTNSWLWGLLSGLIPILAALLLFRFWPEQKEQTRWLILIAGEALGVILGSTLVAGPDSPLMLLALWPVAWAAIRLDKRTGMAIVASMEIIYLAFGLWQAWQNQNPSRAIMGLVLYVAALYSIFFLLRERERVLSTTAVASPLPASVAVAPPPPADPERDETLHQDLVVARDIQVSLLLASSPRLPGWESSTSFLPAQELGGDLYDFVEIDSPTWGIMIGDVTGKGIPAALHMAVARTLFRMEVRNGHDPAQTLELLNRYFIEQAPQGCVTLLYAHLNTADGSLRLANAGHNYPLLVNNSVHELALAGLPLGIDADYSFNETTAHLSPGDVLIFYTDGVVEATNADGELYGFERLRELLQGTQLRRPRSLTRQIVRAVRAFTGNIPQSDDITLVVLRRRYKDRVQEMTEVARDVLGQEGSIMVQEYFAGLNLPADASTETWRAAILTLGNQVRDQRGRGLSRELMQQLFLTLEGL